MMEIDQFKASAESLAVSLDNASGSEHHFSKQIRRFFKNGEHSTKEIISKFKFMIDHDDGLLNSIDNELIQLCYPCDANDFEKERIKQFISLLESKTEFVKRLFLLPNSSLIGLK